MLDVMDDLLTDLAARVEALPKGDLFQLTNRGLRDPRWVKAVLTELKKIGLAFKFYTPSQERTFGPSGFCRWFDETGAKNPHLYMSSNLNSVDALRVAAHEMAHALTLTAEQVKEWGDKVRSQSEFMRLPEYCWGETIADSTAAIVATVASPKDQREILQKSAVYIRTWPGSLEYLRDEANRDLIKQTAVQILTTAVDQL